MKNEINYTTDKTFEVIKSATDKLVEMVRPTYGPAGNKVIIDKGMYRMVVDDGVQIARDFEVSDPMENAVIKQVKETAIKTNDRVGDGTTGALLMVKAILDEVSKKRRFDGRKVKNELQGGLIEATEQLKKTSKRINTWEEIKKVAMISYDDEKTAEMIADLYWKVGEDGVITTDKSPTMETTSETTDGIKLESGYLSPYMVTNPQRMEADIDNVHILITDYRLTEANDIIPLLNKMASQGKNKLVIISENIENRALATMVINLPHVMNPETNKPGTFQSLGIAIPKVKDTKQFLEDIALMTGSNVLSESKGNKLENVELSDLGYAKKIISRQDESIIVNPQGKKKDISNAIKTLKTAIKDEKEPKKKEQLRERLGLFTNNLAVIRVGAPTDAEQKALKYKVDDAIHSTRSALKNGVVCGAGIALSQIETSSDILNEALKYPHKQLVENMGIEEITLKKDHAVNVVTGRTGPFMEVGVADPTDVLIAGIESAVSISSILLTSSGIYVESPKED